jgi:hypothetical protein
MVPILLVRAGNAGGLPLHLVLNINFAYGSTATMNTFELLAMDGSNLVYFDYNVYSSSGKPERGLPKKALL